MKKVNILNSTYKDILLYDIEIFKNRKYSDDKKSKYIITYHAKLKNNEDIYVNSLDQLESVLKERKIK